LVLDVIRVLGRRWYFVVLGAMLTAGLAVAAYISTPAEYNARALVVLLPSGSAVGETGNPLLALGGLEQPAGILVAYLSSASAREEVEQRSETAEYVVSIDDSTRGPVLAVDVTDADPQRTLNTLGYILDRIPESLTALQDQVDVQPDAVITAMTLTVDERAEPDMGGTIRMMIAAVAVGIALTCTAAFALDGLLRRRALRRAGAHGELRPRRERPAAPTAEQRASTSFEPVESAASRTSVRT
jgi:hypothetical protein